MICGNPGAMLARAGGRRARWLKDHIRLRGGVPWRNQRDSEPGRAPWLPVAGHPRFRLRARIVTDDLDRAVIVAVTAMGMVEVAADEVVGMVAVRHCGVAAAGRVHMAGLMFSTGVLGRADVRIARRNLERTFVHVVPVHGVKAAVVEVVHVFAVANGRMPAAFAMDVGVLRMNAVVRHGQTSVISQKGAKGYNVFEEAFSLINGFSFACMEWIAAKRCRCCARA